MNIAILENHIISTNTVRRKLTQTLIEKGFKVTVLSTGTAKELNFARKLGFEVINVGMSNTNPKEVLQYIKNVYKALKLVNADFIKKQNIFNEHGVNLIYTSFYKGKIERAEKLWHLLMFQMWYDKWINNN